jgi:hypothetical protein
VIVRTRTHNSRWNVILGDYCSQGLDAMYFDGCVPTLCCNLVPPSSGLKTERSGRKTGTENWRDTSRFLFPFHFSHLRLTFLRWRWRQQVNSKRCSLPTKMHGVTFQMIVNLHYHHRENHKSHNDFSFILHFGITSTSSLLGLWLLVL